MYKKVFAIESLEFILHNLEEKRVLKIIYENFESKN